MHDDFEIELYSVQTEMIILGTFYKNPTFAISLFDVVKGADFYDRSTKFYYEFFYSYLMNYSDEITQMKCNTWATNDMDRLKKYKDYGGWKTIDKMMGMAVSEDEAKHQIDVLKKFSLLRELQDYGYDLSKLVSQKNFRDFTVEDCARYVSGTVEKICNKIITGLDEPIDLSENADEIVRNFMATPIKGIDTAFPFLNKLASGLVPGDLTAIGATSNSGKGRSLIYLAAHLALCEDANVAFYGNEMSAESMRTAYYSAVLSSPKIRELIGGDEIFINERDLVSGLFIDADKNPIYRHTDSEGNYTETEEQFMKRVEKESKQYRDVQNAMKWLKEYGKGKLLFKNVAGAYDDISLSRIIKQNRLMKGTDIFFYDTLKNSNKKDLGDWASLVATTTMLKENCAVSNMTGVVSFQMIPAANQMRIEDIDINSIQAAKAIYNLMDTMAMMLHLKKEWYDDYSIKRDPGIEVKSTTGFVDQDQLDPNQFYTVFKLVKNRRGTKDDIYCYKTNLSRNLWLQEGLITPKPTKN